MWYDTNLSSFIDDVELLNRLIPGSQLDIDQDTLINAAIWSEGSDEQVQAIGR